MVRTVAISRSLCEKEVEDGEYYVILPFNAIESTVKLLI